MDPLFDKRTGDNSPANFEISELNRKQRRAMNVTALPASACKVTRFAGKVAIGIEQPGYVAMTDVEAIQLAEALLKLAGANTTDDDA